MWGWGNFVFLKVILERSANFCKAAHESQFAHSIEKGEDKKNRQTGSPVYKEGRLSPGPGAARSTEQTWGNTPGWCISSTVGALLVPLAMSVPVPQEEASLGGSGHSLRRR